MLKIDVSFEVSYLNKSKILNVTRLYILLYKAFLGLVTQPSPLGAFKPNLCLTNLAGERRAEIMPFIDGLLMPNLIRSAPK